MPQVNPEKKVIDRTGITNEVCSQKRVKRAQHKLNSDNTLSWCNSIYRHVWASDEDLHLHRRDHTAVGCPHILGCGLLITLHNTLQQERLRLVVLPNGQSWPRQVQPWPWVDAAMAMDGCCHGGQEMASGRPLMEVGRCGMGKHWITEINSNVQNSEKTKVSRILMRWLPLVWLT